MEYGGGRRKSKCSEVQKKEGERVNEKQEKEARYDLICRAAIKL